MNDIKKDPEISSKSSQLGIEFTYHTSEMVEFISQGRSSNLVAAAMDV